MLSFVYLWSRRGQPTGGNKYPPMTLGTRTGRLGLQWKGSLLHARHIAWERRGWSVPLHSLERCFLLPLSCSSPYFQINRKRDFPWSVTFVWAQARHRTNVDLWRVADRGPASWCDRGRWKKITPTATKKKFFFQCQMVLFCGWCRPDNLVPALKQALFLLLSTL